MQYCGPCANYHIYWTARRTAGIVGGVDTDRPLLAELLEDIAKRYVTSRDRGINVLIPGAADSGLLSVAVAGIFKAGGRSLLQRTKFTVIDQCITPLKLSEEYAQKHDLEVSAKRCNLEDYRPDHNFDLVFAHSVLAFLPPDIRAKMLSAIVGWLDQDGRLVYSARLGASDGIGKATRFETIILPRIMNAVGDGRIRLCEEEEVFLKRCRQRHQGISYESTAFRTIDELRALAESADIEIESVKQIDEETASGLPRRSRVISVFSSSTN